MDEALFKRLVEEAWDRSNVPESIGVTSIDSPGPSVKNQQGRFLRALVELVADHCAKVADDLSDKHANEAQRFQFREFEAAADAANEVAAVIRKRFVNSPQPDPNQRQPGEG